MGKRKKSAKTTKKVKDDEEDEVIKVNIILDFEPGDDFENVGHQQSVPSAGSTSNHSNHHRGLTRTRYTSRGRVVKLRPMRVVVPSVESLLKRYGKYLAVGPEKNDALSRCTRNDSRVPPSSQGSCSSAEDQRKFRTNRRRNNANFEDEIGPPSDTGSVTPPEIPKVLKKKIRSACVKNLNSNSLDKSKIRSKSTAHPRNSSIGSEKRMENTRSISPDTNEVVKSTDHSNKTLPGARLSLPSRISLKKDWMKKLLSRRAEVKKPCQDKIQQVPEVDALNEPEDAYEHENHEDELNPSATQPDHEDGFQIRIDKIESLSDKLRVGTEGRNCNAGSKTSDIDIDHDPEDMPVLVKEIGNAREVQFETIAFKEEVEDKDIVDSSENYVEEPPRATEKDVNFIQFNEDSYDEDGPSEDPLMMFDDTRVSTLEDGSSDLLTGSPSTVQGKNDEVRIVHDFIENTLSRMTPSGRTISTCNQYSDNTKRVSANMESSTTFSAKGYLRTGQSLELEQTDENHDYTLDPYPRTAIEIRKEYFDSREESNPNDKSGTLTPVIDDSSVRSYKCPYCDEIFDDSPSLEFHGQKFHVKFRHTPKKKYACPKCRKRFGSIRWINWHINAKHKHMFSTTPLKYKSSQSERTTLEYKRISCLNSSTSLACSIEPCKDVFDSEETLNNHVVQVHGKAISPVAASLFQCTECPKNFMWQSNLSTHQRFAHRNGEKKNQSRHRPRPSVCSSPNRGQNGEKKQQSRHRPRPSVCSSPNGGQLSKISDIVKKFMCSECPSSFHHASTLSAHKRFTHNNGKLSQSYSWRAQSANSNRVDYACEICGISFTWESNLSAHMRFIHNKELSPRGSINSKPKSKARNSSPSDSQFAFTCSECVGCSFDSISLLSRHKRQMHGTIRKHGPKVAVICPTPHIPIVSADALDSGNSGSTANEAQRGSEIETITLSDNDEDLNTSENIACQFCDSIFQSVDQLQVHAVIHATNTASSFISKQYSCPDSTCGKSFHSGFELNLHLQLETHFNSKSKDIVIDSSAMNKKEYPCSCGMSFKYPKSLKIHEMLVHKKNNKRKKSRQIVASPKVQNVIRYTGTHARTSGMLNYVCVQCDNLSFSSQEDLHRHNQVMHREKLSVALICESGNTTEPTAAVVCQQTSIDNNQVPERAFVTENADFVSSVIPVPIYDHNHPSLASTHHRCPHCSQEFPDIEEFQLHVSTHVQGYLQQPQCTPQLNQDQYASLSEVHEGSQSSAEIPPSSEAAINQRQSLNWKNQEQIISNVIKCSFCPKTFKKNAHRVSHERIHGDQSNENERYLSANCPVCDMHISQSRNLPRHVQMVHQLNIIDSVVTCLICKKIVPLSPSGPQKYMCCKYWRAAIETPNQNANESVLSTEGTLSSSLQKKARSGRNKQVSTGTESFSLRMLYAPKYVCVICNTNFCRIPEVRKHFTKVHSMDVLPVKPYQCAKCKKKLPTLKGVAVHYAQLHDDLPAIIKRGDGEKNLYPCPGCDMKLYSSRARLAHINSLHTGKNANQYSNQNSQEQFESTHHMGTSNFMNTATTMGDEALFNPSEPRVENHSFSQFWNDQPENPSEFAIEGDTHADLANVENVEVDGIMMKSEVEVTDVMNPEEFCDFEFQTAAGDPGDEQVNFTFNIITHPPMLEESFEV